MTAPRSRQVVLENLGSIRAGIERACDRAGRVPSEVRLVAAAKTVEPEAIGWVRDAGVLDVGENYVQELGVARSSVEGITWHFIGTLQSHTAHRVADLADVVQTLAPGRAFERLARRAAQRRHRLPALIEVDLTGDRGGLTPDRVPTFADDVAAADGVELAGLMTLPPVTPEAEGARPFFIRLRELRDQIAKRHPGAVELSMGMSLDYEVAVEEGATMVRIGTALFGARPPLA